MPELPWRRHRRDQQPPEPASPEDTVQDAQRPVVPSAAVTGAEYLRRAADCYLRAGDLTEAASCLSALSTPLEQARAAELYLRAGQYHLAAQTYADAGSVEAAAWTHVHYLADAASARAILEQNPIPNVPPLTVSRTVDPSPAADSSWGTRVRQLGERVAGLPAADTGPASGRPAREEVTELIERVLGRAFSYGDVPAALAEVRRVMAATVAARDLSAAYAARELGRLLTDLQARHSDRDQRVQLRGREDWNRMLAQRQVYARCDVADGIAGDRVLEVLAVTQRVLADTGDAHYIERTETWGVAVAEAMRRYDQAALIFAAAVRGRRPGAAKRWQEWSARVLHADAAIPADLELV